MFGRDKPAADVAVTWESGAVQSPDEARIPLTAVGPQSNAQGIGRTLVIDRFGLRHLEPRKSLYSKFVGVLPRTEFAVRWNELAHVSLQEQYGTRSPLVMLRLVLWPRLPDVFAGQHPDIAALRNTPGLGPGAWALSLGVHMNVVDRQVGYATYEGLTRFAGGLFSGQVERVTG